jgi:hypothetical protein
MKRIEGSRQEAVTLSTRSYALGTRTKESESRLQNEKSEGKYLFSTDY